MKLNKAIVGGVLGAGVMSGTMAMARGMGTMVMVDLMMGAAFAVAYAWLFERLAHRGRWTTGALVMLHVIFGAIVGGVYGDVRNPGPVGLGTRASHA